MERTIGFKERRYIEELRILTKSTALDCIIDEKFDRIIYVIRSGDMGYAIGKKGENIRRLEKVLGRKVEMVEFAEEIEPFLENIFKPAKIISVECDQETKCINTIVETRSDVGIAIGKGGCTIEKARMLVRRFHQFEVGEVITRGESS
ncbi:MAG: NusA-like transcription termination signal-binding factor [Methanospirillaceae archaeon]|nr:NusA-like transcription termination signal-binding factor [Methanospirillaceae archaeon]